MGETLPPALTIEEAIPHFQRGAAMLDTRSHEDYIARHVPGSVHIPADQLAGRLAATLRSEARLILMLADDQSPNDVAALLTSLGYSDIAGYIADGIDAWDAAGLPVTSGDVENIDAMQLHHLLQDTSANLIVVDVREPWEFRMGRVPGAKLIPLGELPARAKELDPNQPVALICAHGIRSVTAASVLGRNGFKKMYNILGGTQAWVDSGLPTERG
jgi:hydroxyacylglutathione hydrolase